MICTSDYENLFCTNTSESDWKRGQCNITGSEIECPLFQTYKTYSKFFLWKITTIAVKIAYEVNGTEYITVDRPVTPYFKCLDIARIGPDDKMFSGSNQKDD